MRHVDTDADEHITGKCTGLDNQAYYPVHESIRSEYARLPLDYPVVSVEGRLRAIFLSEDGQMERTGGRT